MTCGIYSLTFAEGIQYVGKSTDIEKRWVEHNKAMRQNKAAAKMQAAYKKYGLPDGEVLFEIHQDHLDIVECYIIRKYRPVLNSVVSASILECEFDELMENPEYLKWSTLGHIREIIQSAARVEKMETEVEKLLAGYEVPEFHKLALAEAELDATYAKRRLKAYQDLPWYKRLFI